MEKVVTAGSLMGYDDLEVKDLDSEHGFRDLDAEHAAAKELKLIEEKAKAKAEKEEKERERRKSIDSVEVESPENSPQRVHPRSKKDGEGTREESEEEEGEEEDNEFVEAEEVGELKEVAL